MRRGQSELNETPDASATLDSTAYVLLCQPELINDPALLSRYEALLDEEERSRLARFRFKRDAHTFLVAHALVRTALSHFDHVGPGEWRFQTNRFGRPEVGGPSDASKLQFNLSHRPSLIACMVTVGTDFGVDVEEIRALSDLFSLAGHYFSPHEAAALRTLPHEMSGDRFFSLWTLKEAYIKARGLGLSLPLHKFSFGFHGERIAVHFDPDLAENPDDWTFTLMRPTASHFLATAVRRGQSGTRRRLLVRWFVPLVGMGAPLPLRPIASSSATVHAIR